LFVTYLVIKLALQAVVDECNRMALEAETQEQASLLKSRIAQLEMDFASGAIDEKTYSALASEILSELRPATDEGVQIEEAG
jgi:hypothetical protein